MDVEVNVHACELFLLDGRSLGSFISRKIYKKLRWKEMDLRADMNAVIQKEFLFRLGIKNQPSKRYEDTTYINTEKNETNLLFKCPIIMRVREELLDERWSKLIKKWPRGRYSLPTTSKN